MSGKLISPAAAQNCSSAAPGPLPVHFNPNILDTLSNDLPILSSGVVARTRKDVSELASRSSVWPPDISRAMKGNTGICGHDVRRGVSAWAC